MATLQTVITSLETAMDLFTTMSQATAHYRNTDAIATNTSKYQIQAQLEQPSADSNVTYEKGVIEVFVNHKLAVAIAENTYTRGDMVTQMESLLDREFWKTLDGVFDYVADPELTTDVIRIGNVIRWGVTFTFTITPA